MRSLEKAIKVVNILKKEGFEAYIVGGAVRDHLLGHKTNDIDITTNAKPRQTSRLFKTVPTGIKYGTVTVLFQNEEFEVTTYRSEKNYEDHRHPEEVEFINEVLEDVKRRDFTINGLLMNEQKEIIDYIDGKKDLENKVIRAIGVAEERFEEDALRMLRACYFQSKLGFEIAEETLVAMESKRHLIEKIAKERVLDELLKILRGRHVKMAFETILKTKLYEYLPGLEKGIRHALTLEENLFIDSFFALAFTMEGYVPNYYPFSLKHRHKYNMTSKLANEQIDYSSLSLYEYGLEINLLANKTNFILGKTNYQRNSIEKAYEELPLRSESELALRADEITKLLNKKPAAWLGQLRRELVRLVITGELKNDKDELKSFVLKDETREKYGI